MHRRDHREHHHKDHSHSPAYRAAAKMPLLAHFQKGRTFDISESDVAAWLCQQPEIRQEIFNWFKRLGAIQYLDGRWIGAATYSELNREASSPSNSSHKICAATRVL
jgi:hypothetical protein